MARKKLHREPVLKDWAEVNDALRSIHEYEHALTEMGVDMSRRIDAVKAEYTKSAEPLQKRVKQLETDVQEYVEAHREDMAGKSRQLTFGRVGCALPGFVDSKNEEKTERNAGYLVVSHSGGGMLRQGTRKGIRRTPANRGMRAHWVVKGLDISEDVCHGMCP